MVFVYVLRLRENKYYVGKTLNPRFRVNEHFSSTGSKWTKKYKPIDLHQLIPDCDDFDEDKITIQMMQKYGISNVRGGSFSTSKLSKSDLSTINKMIKSSSDLCFNCDEYGHFASNCPKKYKKEITEWQCSYCDKIFTTKKGCLFHENRYCKKKNKYAGMGEFVSDETSDYSNEDWTDDYPKSSGIKCYRCGRKGHYASRCYAEKHISGKYLS